MLTMLRFIERKLQTHTFRYKSGKSLCYMRRIKLSPRRDEQEKGMMHVNALNEVVVG